MKNELGLKIVKKFDLEKKLLRFSKEKKIAKELNTLYAGYNEVETLYEKYLGRKVEYLLYVLLGVAVILAAVWLMPKGEGQISNGRILRNGYNGVEKSIILVAESEGMKTELEILLEPMHYSKVQLDSMEDEVFTYFEETLFLENMKNEYGEYEIEQSLKLPTVLEGYPFSVSWESSNYNVLDGDGTVGETVSKSGESISLTAKLSCYEYVFEKDYSLKVFPIARDWEESFSDVIKKTIEELDENTSEESSFLLPKQIDGHQIHYTEKKDNSWTIIIGMMFIVMLYIWFSMDSNVSKQMEERNQQLLVDYAKFVSKLSLYLSVGLSLESVIKRIVAAADKKRFYARELEIAIRELENHIAQNRAIENFANRCRLPCYIKLSVLINQNIRKGNNNLQKQLKEETVKAFEERENLAKKYAQEAGTKLLFPMLLMLMVVMVMIMYPAFISFTI